MANSKKEFSGFSIKDLSLSQESGLFLPLSKCPQQTDGNSTSKQNESISDCNPTADSEQNESITISEDSQNEISRASGNSTYEFTDPFDCIFYHVMPKEDAGSTDIFFYVRPVFNSIISALEKEYVFPDNSHKKVSLKTHVDGKRCNLEVDRDGMIIRLSGPGRECWREKNFKKLSVNMFDHFIDETKSALNKSGHQSSKNNSRIYVSQEDLCAQPGLFVQADTESPLMNNISGLMDMIHNLQGQVATLIAQVNKLVLQAADSTYETVDETLNQSRIADITSNSNNVAGSLPEPERAILTPAASKTMLTSTPRAKPNGQTHPVPRPRRQAVPVVPPVPKPRQQRQAEEPKQLLLIGDSIITGVNPKGLKQNVHRSGISGATVDSILKEIKLFDLDNFSHVIIYVGGNDASHGTDSEYFEEKYDQLLRYIRQKNRLCNVLLVNICPRGDVDTAEINSVIHRLSQVYSMQLVNADHAFHNKHGEIIDRYYSRDSIHLSHSGIKRLLGTLNNYADIVNNFDQCVYNRQEKRRSFHHQQHTAHRNQANRRTFSQPEQNCRCSKCGETNHNTRQCRHQEQLQCHGCGLYGHKTKRCENI